MPAPIQSPAADFPPSAASPRSTLLPTLYLLALALALRLFVVWTVLVHRPPGWLYQRGVEMGLLAQNLLAGHGLSSPFGPPTGPTAFIAPAYPILVAGVFRLFGVYSQASEAVLMLLNVAANLLTIWLIINLTAKIFDPRLARRSALLAGFFWACSPPLLWLPSIFWETSLSVCLLVGLIALALHCRRHPSRNLWIFLGLYAALAALTNPALIPSLLAILAWTAWQTWSTSRTHILLTALVFLAAFSPWPIRNARVFHAFIPTRTTVGFELWMGNHPNSTGFLDESLFPMYNQHELQQYIQQGEIAYTNGKSALAQTYILRHPATFLALTARRIFRFWTGTGTQDGSFFFAIHSILTSALGLTGLVLLYLRGRRDLASLFALPLLLFPFPYYITHAEFRYRLLLDPLLTILGSMAVFELFAPQPSESANPAPTRSVPLG